MENTQSFEISREKYKDFREMLSDSHLSDDEKAELQESYDYECSEIHEETNDLCSELQNEIDTYEEIKNMSREEIEKFQILSGVPKHQIDGIRGPNTFAYYQSGVFINLSPAQLVESYNDVFENFESIFSELSLEERKRLQSEVGTSADGQFGPNTFQKILEHLQDKEHLQTIFLSDSLPEEIQENEEHIQAEVSSEIEIEQVEAVQVEETPEGNEPLLEITPEELKEKLIEESSGTHRVLIRMLQQSIGAHDDGDFGPNSSQKAIESHPDITSFKELMQEAGIPLESDGLLEGGANMDIGQESFREQYGEFVSILESNFDLPSGIIEAIIAQETKYGAWKLTSPTGCKGMMQLSNNAFDDMDTAHRGNIRNYRESFKNMQLDRLLSVEIDNGERTIGDSIPSPIISQLRVLQNPETTNTDHNRAINIIQNFIKGDSSYFNHAVNMIIGAVYLSGTYHDSRTGGGDITKTADHYNAAPGERATYRSNVTGFYNAIQEDGYYKRFTSS